MQYCYGWQIPKYLHKKGFFQPQTTLNKIEMCVGVSKTEQNVLFFM